MSAIEIKVPDIGDFKEVEVIELLVKPGDTVQLEQSLITVESDKASMEIPSNAAGVVKSLLVKIGDKVAEGSPLLILEAAEAAAPTAPAPASPPTPALASTPAVAASPIAAAAPVASVAAAARSREIRTRERGLRGASQRGTAARTGPRVHPRQASRQRGNTTGPIAARTSPHLTTANLARSKTRRRPRCEPAAGKRGGATGTPSTNSGTRQAGGRPHRPQAGAGHLRRARRSRRGYGRPRGRHAGIRQRWPRQVGSLHGPDVRPLEVRHLHVRPLHLGHLGSGLRHAGTGLRHAGTGLRHAGTGLRPCHRGRVVSAATTSPTDGRTCPHGASDRDQDHEGANRSGGPHGMGPCAREGTTVGHRASRRCFAGADAFNAHRPRRRAPAACGPRRA